MKAPQHFGKAILGAALMGWSELRMRRLRDVEATLCDEAKRLRDEAQSFKDRGEGRRGSKAGFKWWLPAATAVYGAMMAILVGLGTRGGGAVMVMLAASNAFLAAAVARMSWRLMSIESEVRKAKQGEEQQAREEKRLGPRYTGRWVKDERESSDMDFPCKQMELTWVTRRAINLISRAETSLADGQFTFALRSAVPWFKLAETIPTDGTEALCRRRDLRQGKTRASLSFDGDHLLAHMSWGEPIAGHETDTFTLSEGDSKLRVDCSVHLLKGPSFSYTLVFRRV